MDRSTLKNAFLLGWAAACKQEYLRHFCKRFRQDRDFFESLASMRCAADDVVKQLQNQPGNFDEMILAAQGSLVECVRLLHVAVIDGGAPVSPTISTSN